VGLTAKELVVLRLRAEGLTQVAVARRLHITQSAVSRFEHNAYDKLADAQETLAAAKTLRVTVPDKYHRGVRR
jgi:transcriptional regulator